jgi:hypothetical protein
MPSTAAMCVVPVALDAVQFSAILRQNPIAGCTPTQPTAGLSATACWLRAQCWVMVDSRVVPRVVGRVAAARSRAHWPRLRHTSYPVPVRRPAALDWTSSRPQLAMTPLPFS